jgi:hypothetical protein
MSPKVHLALKFVVPQCSGGRWESGRKGAPGFTRDYQKLSLKIVGARNNFRCEAKWPALSDGWSHRIQSLCRTGHHSIWQYQYVNDWTANFKMEGLGWRGSTEGAVRIRLDTMWGLVMEDEVVGKCKILEFRVTSCTEQWTLLKLTLPKFVGGVRRVSLASISWSNLSIFWNAFLIHTILLVFLRKSD